MPKKIYKPVEPVNKKHFLQLGLSIDPKDIPAVKAHKSVILRKMEELEAQAEAVRNPHGQVK